MIKRQDAINLLKKYIKTENTIKHMIACEAIMRSLAKLFDPENEEAWAMAGLLHDLDYEQFKDGNYSKHGEMSVEILKKENADLPESVYQAIKAHSFNLRPEFAPKTKMDWSLFIGDSLTGLIVATTLVRPDKKLSSVTVDSVLKKFKSPSFAAGTRREDIKLCQEKLGLSLEEFIALSLEAMQKIALQLGL
jgi:putative nucleotidyltransferase with HDIG domain